MNKVGYCEKCRKKTVQKVIERNCLGKNVGILFRPIMFVPTLGISEMADNYMCQCSKCGEINKILN